MKKIYKAELNGSVVYLVGEEGNSIGTVFQKLKHATLYKNGEDVGITAVAVNDEVISFGKTIAFIKNKVEVE